MTAAGRDTAHVTRPRTGFAYLDAVLEQPGAVLAFAHRGGAFHPELEGMENTLAAFRHAVDLGYAYLETDVHATRDGVLLAFHDAVLDRITGGSGTVAQMGYDEVAGALIGGREQIPVLADLLERFPTTRFNIDIKSEHAIEPLAALIRRRGDQDRVCVAAFSETRLRDFRRRMGPTVATAVGPAAAAWARLAPTAGLARTVIRSPSAASSRTASCGCSATAASAEATLVTQCTSARPSGSSPLRRRWSASSAARRSSTKGRSAMVRVRTVCAT